MSDLTAFLSQDHRHCDEAWSEVEAEADGPNLNKAWVHFRQRLLQHLDYEEQHLFPTFQRVSGMRGGPVEVMRSEHDRMRALLGQMDDCFQHQDVDGLLNQGDTLLMLIQQHNMKEEGVLYPMMSETLQKEWPDLRNFFPR